MEKGIGHFFLCIDPTRFMPLIDFKTQVAEMAAAIKTSPKMSGVDEIFVPGELEERRRREGERIGVPLAQSTIDMLTDLAQASGVAISL